MSRSPEAIARIGTAGWTIPRQDAADFPEDGSHLQRYAGRFRAVEINSSFHRPHRAATYARWAATVPADFRFSVKIPKQITHVLRLREAEHALLEFLEGVGALGSRLGCLLVQLPPSLEFDPVSARAFFDGMREHCQSGVACEPRHASWLEPEAEALLAEFRIARVAADPDRPAGAGEPGGWPGLRYYRLHGSPRMYYSAYEHDHLERLAARLGSAHRGGSEVWCIFDNTVLGAATRNALDLVALTARPSPREMEGP